MNHMWKKRQRNLNHHYIEWYERFADMKDPLEEENEETQVENIMEEENNEAEEDNGHGLYDIFDDI